MADNEKKILLEKLEKISVNYQLYAEGFKENARLKREKEILAENNSQINIIFNSNKNNLINLIRKNMQYYMRLKMFYENKSSKYKSINIDDFIFSFKEEILNNLLQYKNQLDMINYPTFFSEYNTFIYEECNYHGFNKGKNIYRNEYKDKDKDREQCKENNSFDEYRKYKKRDKDKYNDKTPKAEEKSFKRNILFRDKSPSKSNCDFGRPKNIKNFNNTHFHNNFKINSNNNNSTNKLNDPQDKNSIFSDVGNVINQKKRFSSRK